MKQDPVIMDYGINSISIGPAGAGNPDLNPASPFWKNALRLDSFYPAGGDTRPKASTTASCLAWSTEQLYVLALASDPSPISGVSTEAPTELIRADSFHVGLHTGSMGPNEFIQIKYTLLGGVDVARRTVHPGEKRSDNSPDCSSTIDSSGVTTLLERNSVGWYVLFSIPWKLIGGRPEADFGLQILRARYHSEENVTPFPQDLILNYGAELYDPLLFMEARLESASFTRSSGTALAELPSGKLKWQRPARMLPLTAIERQAIAELQDQLQGKDGPTSESSLGDRLYIVNRWIDMLTLEGFNFFHNMEAVTPWPLIEPWRTRHLVNRALDQGNPAKACEELDRMMEYLDRSTRWWYADGSPGNIRDHLWKDLGELKNAAVTEQGATLEFPTAKLYISFPAEGGIRIHSGSEGYHRPSTVLDGVWEKSEDGSLTGSLDSYRVRIVLGEAWEIIIIGKGRNHSDDIRLGRGNLRFLAGEDGAIRAADLTLGLAHGEQVHGFGERFDALCQNGRILTLWQHDAWEGCFAGIRNQSYKNIPLFQSTQGYGLFWNSSYRLRADIGSTRSDQLRLTMLGPILDLYLFQGKPSEILAEYTALTGRPILPPKWAFEPWAGGGGGRWRNGPMKDPVKEMIGVMDRFAELDIPHSAIYAEGAGPDETLYSYMSSHNIKVLTWDYSVITSSKKEHSWYLSHPETEWPHVKLHDRESFTKSVDYTDFSHPLAMEMYKSRWKPRLDLGVAGTMIDFGDLIPDQAEFHDGRRGDEMHNFYYLDYTKAYRDMFHERRGDDFVLFQRGAAAGSQAFAGCFGGDHPSTFPGMTASLMGSLSIASCGFPFWGVDIGGYYGDPTEEVYLRWVEWGTFLPFMRFHGTSPREPWIYSDEAVKVYKRYAWIRESLLDYSYSAAIHAHHTGEPMMRSMPFAYPELKEVHSVDDQYFYGPDFLVAPVHEEGPVRPFALPPGRWTHLWSGATIQGPMKATMTVPLEEIPVYLRSGAAIPVRLNPSLEWGASMSGGSVGVWVVTPPTAPTESTVWLESDRQLLIRSIPETEGFRLELPAGYERDYVMVYGLGAEAAEAPAALRITVDGQPTEWRPDNGRIIIVLPPSFGSDTAIVKVHWNL